MLRQQNHRLILLAGILLGLSCVSSHAWADTQSDLNGLGQICHDDIEIITVENPEEDESTSQE
jgi:hypothetical protein